MKVHIVFLATLAVLAASVTAAPAQKLFDSLVCLDANVGNNGQSGSGGCGSNAQPDEDEANPDDGTPTKPSYPDQVYPDETPVTTPSADDSNTGYRSKQPEPAIAPNPETRPEPEPKEDVQPEPEPEPKEDVQPEPEPEHKEDVQPEPEPESEPENQGYKAMPPPAIKPEPEDDSNDAGPYPVTEPEDHSEDKGDTIVTPTSPEKAGYVVKTPAKDSLPPSPAQPEEAYMPVDKPYNAQAPADTPC
ncbi:hypothetical protein H4R34_000603 [Dimargaris verticillata]|uniref:Uncharacterized protein n=1 Tax=Dimargaris verticillata TaxID=2761393 RepID=A0A9W8BBI1_9FUNG|nr:hypothetical protein H4R34_000603 [Dimargaris verticillata]